MKILVVGATGETGELTWRKAVAEGHDVTIFERSVAQQYKDDPVRKMQGDVLYQPQESLTDMCPISHTD